MWHRLVNWLRKRIGERKRRPQPEDLNLGVSVSPHSAEPFVKFPASLRVQHLGIIGLSGTGKTHLIERMIRQDIQHKTGFVVFDVHGDLSERVIAYLAERAPMDREIYERTIILEPFDRQRSFGFNPLERTRKTSPFSQAQEFAYMLRKRWQEDLLSPRTEELLRNSLYTLCVNNLTLVRLTELLTDDVFRSGLLEKLPAGEIRTYWTDRYNQLSAGMQSSFREPILSRISSFIGDPQIRDIVCQKESTFTFREAIRNGSWIIINLSSGRLGQNSAILGSMLFTKLELEVMALADVPEEERKLFVVYADELQNLAGETFGRLIAEARKYGIALVAGHQFWKQLDPALRQAMLAVGSRMLFRLHYHDAVELAGELASRERERYIHLLTVLDRGEAIVRRGGTRPVLFTIPAHNTPKPTAQELQTLRTESAKRYTVLRSVIRKQIGYRPKEEINVIKKKRGNKLRKDTKLKPL
jgi:Type IV secretion-system coupling protein DNA-binding domain